MADPKILIVDDDPQIRKLIYDFISAEGYNVEIAANGLDALKLVEHGCYKLIITDYEMPKMNGLEFTKKVRERQGSPSIIATSGSDVKALFLEAGADLFMPKPIDLSALKREMELMEVYP